jgi:hypothetical protein
MVEPTRQHKFEFKLHGQTVTMEILAYRKLNEYEINTCVTDYIRSLKKKKLKKDVVITWKTIFGVAD